MNLYRVSLNLILLVALIFGAVLLGTSQAQEAPPVSHTSSAERSRFSALKLTSPRVYRKLPSEILASSSAYADARIIGNVRYLARRFDMAVTRGRSDAVMTHGSGTSIDFVPAKGGSWEQVDAAARFLRRQSAIGFAFYHGRDHLHVQWINSYGSSYAGGALRPPARWVAVFG